MRKYSVVFGVFLAIVTTFVLLLIVSPVAGFPLSQPEETQRAETIDAFVHQGLLQTQTAIVRDLYATANATFQLSLTPTPARGRDASARYQALEHLGKGWEYYYWKFYALALEEFDSAVELAPQWAEGYVGRGMVHAQLGQNSDAIDDFEQAVILDNNDADLYGWLASAYFEEGNYAQALDNYERAIEFTSLQPVFYNNRGYTYAQIGRYDDAIADYTTAISLDPTEPIYYGNRQRIYDIREEWTASLVDMYLNSGLQHFEDNERGNAIEDLTRALSHESAFDPLEPEVYAYVHFNLGRLHVDFGNMDLALEAFETAINLEPDFAAPRSWIGEIYAADGDYETAFDYYDEAIATDLTYAQGYLYRALAYDTTGQHDLAVLDYWKWIQLNQARDVIWDVYTPGETFTIGLDGTWTYYIPFEVQAGQIVSIGAKVSETSLLDVDPLIIILDASGQPIAGAGSEAPFQQATLDDLMLPTAGKYTAVIGHGINHSAPVSVRLDFGPVLSNAEIEATVRAYTPTPTLTLTPTLTPSQTPTVTPTPTATLEAGAADFEPRRELDLEVTTELAWQDDQHIVASHAFGLSQIQTASGRQSGKWEEPTTDFITALAVSPDRKLLVVAAEDIFVLDMETGESVATLYNSDSVSTLVFSPDGTWMVSSSFYGNEFNIWDMTTFEKLYKFEGENIDSAAISPDGRWMVTYEGFYGVMLWDMTDPANPQKSLQLMDAGDADVNWTNLVAFSPDGRILAGVDGYDIILWDMATFTVNSRLTGHTDYVNCLSFSPDGRLLASASDDRTVRLWQVPSETGVVVLGGPELFKEVEYVAFNPSGDELVTLDDSYSVRTWRRAGASMSAAPIATATPEITRKSEVVEHLAQGWAAFFLKDNSTALDEFKQVIELEPGWIEGYIGRAMAEFGLLNMNAAIGTLGDALEIDPDDAYVISWRGALLLNTGQAAKALEDLNRAIELDPHLSPMYDNRGYLYARAGKQEEAFVDLTMAITNDPTRSLNFEDRANVDQSLAQPDLARLDGYMRDGLRKVENSRWEEAIADFNQAITDPSATEFADPVKYAYYNLGQVYLKLGAHEQAGQAFQSAVDLDASFAAAYTGLGETYANTGDYDTAFVNYNRALELNPNFAKGYLLRALAFDATGQAESALSDYWTQSYLNEVRHITWDRYVPGTPFSIAFRNGWVYYIPFDGESGQRVSFRAEIVPTIPSELDPLLILLNPDGEPIAANNNAASSRNAFLDSVTLPTGGEYTLVVSYTYLEDGLVQVWLDIPSAGSDKPQSTAATPTVTPAVQCSVNSGSNVNLRAGPSTEFSVVRILPDGEAANVDGQAIGTDSSIWWHLTTDEWVRSDVVEELGNCDSLPNLGAANRNDTTPKLNGSSNGTGFESNLVPQLL